MSVLPNLVYKFSAIPVKMSASYFVGLNKLLLKFIERNKRPKIANTILKEKNKVKGLILHSFINYSKAMLIKTLQYWLKNRQIDEWNKTESPARQTHIVK